jgi:hypothetical protein
MKDFIDMLLKWIFQNQEKFFVLMFILLVIIILTGF